ncbi:ABC transporter permease [Massilia sp. CFBP9012]|uniref:ABC transporter permease subunit n=1 Tax=Massilia sp. CFBP9012 TaxID=3096531 RepID=UPI002A6B6DE9|nr:ABC transporter permease [Massilia sp. CFBP9012]MDY0977261.1 ABC transporter permease [Massilia sp. CFBP9012]
MSLELSILALLAVLRAATPILYAALGGLLSELGGKINVALEGLMLVAAFTGVIAAIHPPPGLPLALLPWWGLLAGLLAALLLAALLAVLHLECGADLIVAGIALNLLAAGLTVFLLAELAGDKGSTASFATPALPSLRIPVPEGWPLLDLLLNGESGHGHHVLVLGAPLLALAAWAFLRHTRAGAWLRATGENPAAALAAGIPVRRMHYLALLGSGVLAGLGGIYLSMGVLTLFQAEMTAGRGFLALAAVFVGARRLAGVCGAALLFGAAAVLATRLGTLDVPPQLLTMLPPLVTIAVLALPGWRRHRHSNHR